MSERAPVAMIRASASTVGSSASGSPTHNGKGEGEERSRRLTLAVRSSAPKRMAWLRMMPMSSGPMTPSTKPG